jgi:hypothetical protein
VRRLEVRKRKEEERKGRGKRRKAYSLIPAKVEVSFVPGLLGLGLGLGRALEGLMAVTIEGLPVPAGGVARGRKSWAEFGLG